MTAHDITTEPPQLAGSYPDSVFDPLRPTDLLRDEIRQRHESGYDVAPIVDEANDTDPTDRAAVLALVDGMAGLQRRADWGFEEPDDLDAIRSSLPSIPQAAEKPWAFTPQEARDKITAGWLGRIAGCNLGKPIELGSHWTVERIRDYLELAGAYPLTDYVPVLDPMPAQFQLTGCWPETTRGNVDGSARDDDIDYSILALHLLERHGAGLRPEHIAEAWTSLLPLRQVYTAERAAYINLTNGISPRDVAAYRNPYREWIGAQIRGDVFGYTHPGDPWAAAQLAFQDASLSHVGNGIYGEMWAAALVAAAFTASSAHEAIVVSLGVVPPRSRLAAALHLVLDLYAEAVSWEHALERIRQAYGHYSWVHTINNAAVVAAGLLWGEGDFTATVGKTVMSGWDTDSNGATAGSVAGILAGTAGLPAQLIEPLQDRTRSALFGFDNARISDLAERSYLLAIESYGEHTQERGVDAGRP